VPKGNRNRYPFYRNASADVTRDDFTRLFSPNGALDDFFQKQLASHVDIASKPWKFRKLGDASAVQPSPDLIQFQRAHAIRETFFRGAAVPSMKLEFRPVTLDPSITQLTIDIDGQVIKYSHGPQVVVPVQWPGPKGAFQVRLQATPSMSSGSQAFEGPWALLRLLDRAQLQPTSQSEKMLATFNVEGRTAQFEVTSASVQNPLRLPELNEFRCPARL
jgi:type VI secretion system protein ImpL